MGTGIFSLLKERAFLPFFLTQFFGACNDNIFKLAMLTLISYHLTHNQEHSEYYQALASALFTIPFFLFSATAGELADKYDKARITRLIKLFEIFLMIVGSVALYCGAIFWMLATLTGLGVHSAFFSPIKYSILPDHLSKERIPSATALVEASTFIAILLGATLGALSVDVDNASPYMAIFLTIFVAALGYLASRSIPKKQSYSPDLQITLKFWNAIVHNFKLIAAHRTILVTSLIISWFWMIGSIVLTKLPDYTNYVLGANNQVFALFLALFSIGIACGSLMVNLIFRGRLILSIVPWAMFAVSWFAFDLYQASNYSETQTNLLTLNQFFSTLRNWRITLDLFFLAFSSGLFVVPLYTYLQVGTPASVRARIIAANNIYNSLFVVLGSVLVLFILHFSADIPHIFLVLSSANAVVALLVLLFWHSYPVMMKYSFDKQDD